MNPPASPGRAVFVLGMHRSGTSCLAGCLEECGLALGHVNRSAPYNRKGNNENRRIMELHDDILRHSGGAWDDPPERVVWADEHRRRRDQILDEYQGLPVYGIKDPRTLLTLEGWLEGGLAARFVGTFRHPLAVAASLANRDGFSAGRALQLWARYNRVLAHRSKALGFGLVSFDLPEPEYLSSVIRAARGLGLNPPADATAHRFFDASLRTHGHAALELPAEVSGLYRELEGLARR